MAKVNLGCGLAYKEGYINVDKDEKVNPDVVADVRIIPWIWAKPNSTERIEMNNLAEHLEPFIEVVQECHRTLKNGGILWIKVPYLKTVLKTVLKTNGSSGELLESVKKLLEEVKEFVKSVEDCVSDPTHFGLKFTLRTFEYFDHTRTRWHNFGKSYGIPRFKLVKQQTKDRFLIVELEAVK